MTVQINKTDYEIDPKLDESFSDQNSKKPKVDTPTPFGPDKNEKSNENTDNPYARTPLNLESNMVLHPFGRILLQLLTLLFIGFLLNSMQQQL